MDNLLIEPNLSYPVDYIGKGLSFGLGLDVEKAENCENFAGWLMPSMG
jgi:hypothetical protein